MAALHAGTVPLATYTFDLESWLSFIAIFRLLWQKKFAIIVDDKGDALIYYAP